jgi:hypothetical protein
MYKLIPFFVITIIILTAFMYMYYVQRYDEGVQCNPTEYLSNINNAKENETIWDKYNPNLGFENATTYSDVCTCDAADKDNFCSYEAAFLNVFGYLAGGPDDTVDFLDIVCGMVVVIVFLNVVIAIVSNAW